MKFASLRNSLCVLLATAFAFTSISSQSETRCPGILPTLHPRIVAGALIVIPVKINQSGPFDFMLDTGSQLNVIDPALAAQLNLKSQGTVGLVAAAAWSQASVGVADSLQVGPQTVLKPLVVTQDLGAIQLEQPLLKRAKVQGSEVSDARRAFAVLPPQDMRLGSRIVRRVPFLTPASRSQNVPDREEAGILATVLFQRVYVSHSDRFVIFDPK